MHGETRRKARRRYSTDEALRRVSPRRRRERRRMERERGRDREHRAELDQRCQARLCFGPCRAEPSRVRRLRQDSPPTAYMYTPSGVKDAGIGRSRKASTVARNKAAHWKANQHSTGKDSEPQAKTRLAAEVRHPRHFIMSAARSFANFAPSGTGEPSATSAVS